MGIDSVAFDRLVTREYSGRIYLVMISVTIIMVEGSTKRISGGPIDSWRSGKLLGKFGGNFWGEPPLIALLIYEIDGDRRFGEVVGELLGNFGEVLGILGRFRDVSARHKNCLQFWPCLITRPLLCVRQQKCYSPQLRTLPPATERLLEP